MNIYKHLVVAIDGSETALNASKRAADLANSIQTRLSLVHVTNPAECMAPVPEFLRHESYEAAAMAQGNEVLDFVGKTAAEYDMTDVVKCLLVANRGAREMAQDLVNYADENGADLLVLDTHGHAGLMHLLMDSFAETVMRQSHLPLLIIRSKAREEARIGNTPQVENTKGADDNERPSEIQFQTASRRFNRIGKQRPLHL